MACGASSMAVESYPEAEANASATATPSEETGLLRDRRRRHSFQVSRRLSCDYQDADAVFIRV
jgi:adiponectin receptor